MRFSKRVLWVLPVLLLAASSANAGSVPAKVYFSGQYAFANGGYAMPPYGGTMNGQSELFYCVDFPHEIDGDTSWLVNPTNVNSSAKDFGGTRLDNKKTYLEMAWLVNQMSTTTDQTTQAELQWAVWSFTDGALAQNANNAFLKSAAFAVNHGFNGKGWEILTPTGDYGQEFLIHDNNPTPTPEPSSLILFGTAILGIITFRRMLFGS